jgi:glycerophosphoryl diester phosphodiesterase
VPGLVRWSSDAFLHRLRVPTLVEALETARSVGVRVAVDAKDAGAAGAVLDAVHRTKTLDGVLLWSQHLTAVRAFAQALPGADVGVFRDTFDEAGRQRLLDDAVAVGARAVSVHQDTATPHFIAAARAGGLNVYVGYQTVEVQAARLATTAAAGLAGVVTDWAAEARAILERND